MFNNMTVSRLDNVSHRSRSKGKKTVQCTHCAVVIHHHHIHQKCKKVCHDHHRNQGHLHIADILLTAGADVNQQCCQGASPLAVSAQVIIGVVLMIKIMTWVIIGTHDVDDEKFIF